MFSLRIWFMSFRHIKRICVWVYYVQDTSNVLRVDMMHHTCAANIIEKVELLSNVRSYMIPFEFSHSWVAHIKYIFYNLHRLGVFSLLAERLQRDKSGQGRVKAGSFINRPATQHNTTCFVALCSLCPKKKYENMLSCYYEPTRLRDAFTFL